MTAPTGLVTAEDRAAFVNAHAEQVVALIPLTFEMSPGLPGPPDESRPDLIQMSRTWLASGLLELSAWTDLLMRVGTVLDEAGFLVSVADGREGRAEADGFVTMRAHHAVGVVQVRVGPFGAAVQAWTEPAPSAAS